MYPAFYGATLELKTGILVTSTLQEDWLGRSEHCPLPDAFVSSERIGIDNDW